MSASDQQGLLPLHNGAGAGDNVFGDAPRPSRSHYYLSRDEILKGVANRFVHSTAYIYFYFGMAALSAVTVVLSILQDCPTVLFYSLEFVINIAMIAEVGIRLVAFGRQFWSSLFNTVDLFLTLLCAITLAVIFFSSDCPSGRAGKGEELLDSLLLIGRNAVQCGRLLLVMRRSGNNMLTRPTRIDLSNAQRLSLDIDLDDDNNDNDDDNERLAEERRADGGDPSAQERRWERETVGGGTGWGAGGGDRAGRGGRGGRGGEERIALFDAGDEDDL